MRIVVLGQGCHGGRGCPRMGRRGHAYIILYYLHYFAIITSMFMSELNDHERSNDGMDESESVMKESVVGSEMKQSGMHLVKKESTLGLAVKKSVLGLAVKEE